MRNGIDLARRAMNPSGGFGLERRAAPSPSPTTGGATATATRITTPDERELGARAAVQGRMTNTRRPTPFQEFYARYGHLLRTVVKIWCPPEEIADVVSAVWARVYIHWPFHGVKNVEAYLTSAAKNEVKMFFRNRGAQKRPPPDGRIDINDGPSGANLDARLVTDDAELTGVIDTKRLKENFLELGDELSGDNGELLERFLERPSGISSAEFNKLKRSAKKHLKGIGDDVDPLKEGPSFVGHVAAKLRKKKGGDEE
jgi:DNA-directed RNA polymerase specialized sigma24 family protein